MLTLLLESEHVFHANIDRPTLARGICDGFTLLFSMAKKKRRTVPRLVPEDPASDIEDRDEALQPDLTEAQQNRKASGEGRAARDRDNTYHGRKCKIAHLIDHLPQELWDAFLADAVQPRVEAISERAVLASLLFGLLVRGLFTIRVADPLGLHDQPVYTDIPVSQAAIPDLSCRNLFLQLVRGLPGDGANTRPNAAVAAVLAAHPDLRARLAAIPRHPSDYSMVDHVGKQLETAFSNMLTVLFAGRLKKSVSLAGAKVLLGTEEHQRRFGFWGEMEAAMAAWQLDMVPWQQAELTNPGLLPRPPRPPTPYAITPTSKCRARHVFIDTRGLYGMMRDAGMLGVLTEQGVTSLAKFRNAAMCAFNCRVSLQSAALCLPCEPTQLLKCLGMCIWWLRVANRWDALLPDPRRQKLASPKHSFAQIVHTDGVAISVMFLRPKPAAPPAELPRMGMGLGAVNPLAHLDAEWLGVDPGKSNMATVAHEERSAAGTVVSVRHWKLTAGQYYRDSGITRQTQATKTWLAKVEPQLTALSRVSSKPSSLASYRQFADTVLATYDAMWAEVSKQRWANAKFRLYCGKMRVVASFWAKVKKQAQKRWPDRILALAYGAASFSGSGSVGCRGVPVSQMRKEAVKQFGAGRVVLVDEFRTSRVSSAYSSPSEALPGQPPETFRWLRPVYSEAKRSQVRGLMCSTSNNIRFYDRDVSAVLNIRRCAVGPGPRPNELCYWDGRPAMPKRGRPGQEWVYLPDKALLRKWRRKGQRHIRSRIRSQTGSSSASEIPRDSFFGNAGIGTRGGWGAKAVLQACRKVVERANSGKPTDRVSGKVVTVDEFRTSSVSSIMNSPQPCVEELDSSKPTRPEGWKPRSDLPTLLAACGLLLILRSLNRLNLVCQSRAIFVEDLMQEVALTANKITAMYSGPFPFSALDFPELTAFTNVAGPGSCLVYNGSGHLALQPHGSGSMTVQSNEADSDSDSEEVGSRQAAADMETTFGENEEEEEGSELGSEPVQLYAIPPKGRRAALVPASDSSSMSTVPSRSWQQQQMLWYLTYTAASSHRSMPKDWLLCTPTTGTSSPAMKTSLSAWPLSRPGTAWTRPWLTANWRQPCWSSKSYLLSQQFVEVMRCQAEHRVEQQPTQQWTTKLCRYLAGQPITKADILEYIKLATRLSGGGAHVLSHGLPQR
ncbi:hypothetical protein QJQ45_019658 [Haematococcus lacustris]|nr:hypothetical protein QJQ45_019658 [Haematococcus lacustris]